MSTVETVLVALLAVLVAVRLMLWMRGGAAAAMSPAQHADALRIAVARELKGRRARVGPERLPGVAAVVAGVPVQVTVRPLGRDEVADVPEAPLPDGLAPAALGDHRAEIRVRVAYEHAAPVLLWARTPDPRLPEPAPDDGAPLRTGDDDFDAWIGSRSADAGRAQPVLEHDEIRDLCRRLLLVNAPWGARLRADEHGVEYTTLATARTTPQWVARAVFALVRVGHALAGK
jgi:hypothetical protein